MAKIEIETIQEELAKDGWKLLSTEYKNLDSELTFECNEGHKVYNSWGKLRTKRECPTCKENVYANIDTKVIPKKKGVYRTLALDQATHVSGWAIYDDHELVKFGLFETTLSDEIARDNAVKNWLRNMLENWKPDQVAIEGIQYEKNQGVVTFQTLARLQGILMEFLYARNVKYVVCPTNTWRAHCKVKGKTRADKKASMQNIVKELYDVKVNNDLADAIGIGKYASDIVKQQPKIATWGGV